MSLAASASTQAIIAIINLLVETEEERLSQGATYRSGQQYMDELLSSQNPRRIKECLRMELHVFQKLSEKLKAHGSLEDSPNLTVEHQVHMFLHIVATDASNRNAKESFQHSGETISRYFHLVLNAIIQLEESYINQPSKANAGYIPVSPEISKSTKFYPYFQNCIGALDGSLVPVTVPSKVSSVYHCRKGFTIQNILVVCSFDFTFQYVLAGWAGSVHDSCVLENAKKKGFKIPDGKYYLADAGYASSTSLLVPYRDVRYHLKEQA